MISLRTFCRPSSSLLPCNSFLFRSIATKNSYHQRLKALRSEDFRSYKDKSNEAKAVFQDMLKSDHKPKAKEFFCLISILLRHKRLEEAMRYFQLLLDSYHHLLSDPKIDAVFASFVGFYKHRETLESYSERASLLFDTMKQYQVPFTSSVFAAWLSARARLSSPEIDYVALVEDVLARASECDCKVDIVLLNAIVKCLVESKNVDQARMYYEQYEGEALKKLGFFRSVQSTWNALLRWARDFDEALRYFDLFEKHKVFKNSESYSSLLQALLRDQTLSSFKKAAYRKKILKDLRDSKIALHTTGVSLLTVLMVEEGMHWRDILSENEEFNMQEEVLASMLEALHRLHKKYEVLECWDELYAREDFAPLMARMPSKGWVAFIGSCQGKTNERSMSDYLDEERSNEMAEHMAELDVKIDEAIVCKWIECFCYGDLGSAEYMFRSVLDGLVPGVPTLNEPHLSALLFNLSSHRRGAVLVKDFFFQGFEKLRQKPSSRACRYYIRSASIAKEHFREVVNFFRRLPDMGIPCDEFMCYTILKVAQAQPETEWGVTVDLIQEMLVSPQFPKTQDLRQHMAFTLARIGTDESFEQAEEILLVLVDEGYDVDSDVFHVLLFSFLQFQQFRSALDYLIRNTKMVQDKRGFQPFSAQTVERFLSVLLAEMEYGMAQELMDWAADNDYQVGKIGSIQSVLDD